MVYRGTKKVCTYKESRKVEVMIWMDGKNNNKGFALIIC